MAHRSLRCFVLPIALACGCGRFGFDAGEGRTDVAAPIECIPPQGCTAATCGGGSCYAWCPAMTWVDASNVCVAWGGHLACVGNEAENACLSALPVSGGAWIGLTQDMGTEPDGGWRWVCPEPLDFVNWTTGEPNDAAGDEDCGKYSGLEPQQWNDGRCTEPRGFICER